MIFRKKPRLPDQAALEGELAELVRKELLTDAELASPVASNPLEALDSIRILRLCALVEERYGVKIPDEDVTIENFSSCGALAAFLVTKSRG